jgi:hypothetical protein
MSFTYDLTTDVGKVRFFINDQNEPAQFTDEEIQAMLDLNGGSLYLAAAMCLESLASKYAGSSTLVQIGDFETRKGDKSKQYLDAAQRMREVEDNIPSFAIAEQNLSSFNEIEIIRNWVFRTEGF